MIEALRNNLYRGIFKMATGTGKTHTALLSLEEFFQEKKKYGNRILIIVPQHNLVEQWTTDLHEFYSGNAFVLSFDSKTSTIDQREARKTWKCTFGVNDNFNVFLVITVDSIKNFKPFNTYAPEFIIGDEVHTYGTEKRMKALNDRLGSLKYGLGLSATPERIYDPEGTERVFDYFGPLVYEYNLKEAQKDGILAKYNYYPSLVDLTWDEEEQVAELTKEIGKKIAIDFKNELSEKEKAIPESIKNLMRQRATILKKARNKLNALKGILNDNKDELNQCIVYCEDTEQLLAVQEVFDDLKNESYVKYYADIRNRETALNLFKDNNCNFILSMHCLDQGVNIPSCESLILLSSSGNPREYIQRRGRVLRNPTNEVKPIVKIFDIFAFPRNLEEDYRGFIMTQMIRAWEFISCSRTPEAKMKFKKIQDAYGINSDEITEIIERW